MSTETGMQAPATTEVESGVVALRRNVWLSGLVAGLAALIGLGYLLRGGGLDVVVGVLLLLVALLHGAALGAARTPVLVADAHGIRMRIGLTWRGLPWGSVRQVVVERADSPLRESRLVVVPRDPAATLDHLGLLGRLHLRWNEVWYGAALSVPLGMTTLTDSSDLGGELAVLADGRTDVVQLRGRNRAQLEDVVAPPRADAADGADTADRTTAAAYDDDVIAFADLIDGTIHGAVHGAVRGAAPYPVAPAGPDAEDGHEDTDDVPLLPAAVDPIRPLNHPARVEVRLDTPAIARHGPPTADLPTGDTTADDQAAGMVPAQRRPDEVTAPDLLHAEAWEEVPVEVEAEDLSVHAPAEPVIGPKIAHAREMLVMSIDELSQRTRIRPHVLEAIEVDDFGPCGGDFYARGHLTAIARVLGLNLEPLMREYDERYAGGPINARRVFEAELATGLSSGMRATRGGPQWTLLVVAVLALTMVWAVARLLSGDPAQVTAPPASSSESAGLAANRQPITSPLMKTTPMTVTAAHAGAHVVVRDRTGRILWSGDLRMTHHRKVVGLAPFRVESDNAGAIEVTVAGQARGTLGTAGQAASRRFG